MYADFCAKNIVVLGRITIESNLVAMESGCRKKYETWITYFASVSAIPSATSRNYVYKSSPLSALLRVIPEYMWIIWNMNKCNVFWWVRRNPCKTILHLNADKLTLETYTEWNHTTHFMKRMRVRLKAEVKTDVKVLMLCHFFSLYLFDYM